MSDRDAAGLSRRAMLAGLAAAAARIPPVMAGDVSSRIAAAPVFSLTGPEAARYGAPDYPIENPLLPYQPGNPNSLKYRVGAFSHYDEIFPTRRIARAVTPWQFKRTSADLRYIYKGKPSSVADYLSRNPVTGLLIAKDDQILFEHYQYGRTDRGRLLSQSMVKSITGLRFQRGVARLCATRTSSCP